MFRTPLKPAKSVYNIDNQDSIFLMGSCFAENIGNKLNDFKFKSLINPFGIIYNPISIFKLLSDSLDNKSFDRSKIIQHQEVFRHFDFHSDISSLNEKELINKSNKTYQKVNRFIRSSKWVIFSLGTSIVYKLKPEEYIVANCHKVPATHFDKTMLSSEEIIAAFNSLFHKLKALNPQVKIILTISPVRHMRDSFESNSLSKSILRVAADGITKHHEDAMYFPSYEIMMDDLRDYRFYATDMLHPNKVAVDYIWDLFIETYCNKETAAFIKDWNKIRNALNHRAFNPGTSHHKNFIKKTISQLLNFKDIIDISDELKRLENQLLDK